MDTTTATRFPLRPCQSCGILTADRRGYVDDGDGETGPMAAEFVVCGPCQRQEAAEADAMQAGYKAYVRSQYGSDEECQAAEAAEDAYYRSLDGGGDDTAVDMGWAWVNEQYVAA